MATRERFAPAGRARSISYRVLWAIAGGFFRSANACLLLAAGLLRGDDLEAASRLRWREYSAGEGDGVGLDAWERRVYTEALRHADRILLIGCGAGRDLIGLLELGYDVTGLDLSQDAIDLARAALDRRGLTARLVIGPVEHAAFDGSYDAVIFSSRCYSCIVGRRQRVATLTRLRACMPRDARLLVSYTESDRQSPVPTWLVGLTAGVSRSGWRPENGDSFVADHLAPRVLRYEHLFLRGEAARECAEAGFEVVRDELVRPSARFIVAVPCRA